MRRILSAGAALWLAAAFAAAQSQKAPTGPLADVSIEQKLNAPLPPELAFRDESGRTVRLGDYFGRRPVLLDFVYYHCPMLCTYVENGVVRSLRAMSLSAGKDFDLVTVSFDPADLPRDALARKTSFLQEYGRAGADSGVHYLTGDAGSIARLAAAAGFRYVRDSETGEFAHAAALMVATPEGRLSHYFFGVEYAPGDVRLALVEASRGAIGSPVDRVLLYCSRYDPATGKYGVAVMRVVRLAGGVTVAAIALMILLMSRRGAKKKISAAGAA